MSDGALGKRVTLNVIPAEDIMLENVYAAGAQET